MNGSVFAFAIGAGFGAMVVAVAICAAIVAASMGIAKFAHTTKGKPTDSGRYSEIATRGEELGRVEGEHLKKQIENFLNYNGTGEGQMPIGDE